MIRATPDPRWRIPARHNVALVALVWTAALALLWLGSRFEGSWWVLIGLGIVYSYLMLTNYSLMHEAAHDKLHPHPPLNHLLGICCGLLFPMSHTLLHNTHRKHHLQNRSRDELFDLYLPGDNLLTKRLQWYGIMTGAFWFWPVIGSVVLALVPPAAVRRWFQGDPSWSAYTANFSAREILWMRIELAALALFFLLLVSGLGVSFQVLAVYYGFSAINWSTRQFVEHAYTSRDVIEGSLNLRHFRWMSAVLLHRELDLNHHRYPSVPWCYLPCLGGPGEQRRRYLAQYFRMWRGPIPAAQVESAP